MKTLRVSAQLLRAIRDSGLSRYEIAQRTGITQATLSRFVNGKTGLNTESVDKLADFLGLTLVKAKRKGGRR